MKKMVTMGLVCLLMVALIPSVLGTERTEEKIVGGEYDPFSEPVQIDYVGTFLFDMSVFAGIVVIFYFLVIRRYGKGKKLRTNNKSAFYTGTLFKPLLLFGHLAKLPKLLHYLIDFLHGIFEYDNTMPSNIPCLTFFLSLRLKFKKGGIESITLVQTL